MKPLYLNLTLSRSTFWFHPVVRGGGLGGPMAHSSAINGPIFKIPLSGESLWKSSLIFIISNFLSFIVWPLEAAEVTKVSCVKFFQQKIQNFNFLPTNMLYTSKESIFPVEFKFTTKNRIWLKKMGRKFVFLIFASKIRATRYLRKPISKNCTNKSQK